MCSYVLCNNWMQAGYRAVLRPLSAPCMAERATRPLQHLDAHRHCITGCRLAGSRAAAGRRLPTVESAFAVASPRPPNTARDVSLKKFDVSLVCIARRKDWTCPHANRFRAARTTLGHRCTATEVRQNTQVQRHGECARNLNLSICDLSFTIVSAEYKSSVIMVTH